MGTKIATCNYCGTRAALVLRGSGRHELSCSACGAPLHDLKAMKSGKTKRPKSDFGISHRDAPKARHPQKNERKQKRKGGFRWFLEEAFDVIEDILD